MHSIRARKGVSPLFAGVLYFAIVLAGITLVVQLGTPALSKMKDVAAIGQAKDTLSNLDRVISLVAEEGRGSSRVVPIQIKRGDILLLRDLDEISYEIDTEALVVSPRTKRKIGNLLFSSEATVRVYNDSSSWILENEHLRVNITKGGTSSSFVPLNASTLLKQIYFKDRGLSLDGNVSITVDDNPLAEAGYGYTYAEALGQHLPRGTIVAYLNTTDARYRIYFSLESGADFLEVYAGDYYKY